MKTTRIESQYGWKLKKDGSAERTLSPAGDKGHREICKATMIPYRPSTQMMFAHEVEQMLNRGWGLEIMNLLPGNPAAEAD